MGIIKTPDQRVRVFISSTINELAEERQAAREAISNLRLTPVFFEAGARPHPPRDLYSAYLDQSHIFVGIYWNSYGWIAPGSEISGLEDEYRLCGKKPKLIYVKASTSRQDKLNDLLSDIQRSDSACYQKFETAEELRVLLENDLSVLMSETFENAMFSSQDTDRSNIKQVMARKVELPAVRGAIIGREDDLQQLQELAKSDDVRVITILGAGGTGKTTVAISLAHMVQGDYKDGALFVPLAPVTDFNLVPNTVASVLGLQDNGKQPIVQTIEEFLIDREMLLVLDNFEQVVGASAFVSQLLTNCRKTRIIITSRSALHIRGEYLYNLKPLQLPDTDQQLSVQELLELPSIRLFVQRAGEVNQSLPLNAENVKAIGEICNRVDGLPLAIELAAARTRLLQPTQLLARMGKSLDMLNKGQKDLPERQQTLRSAIAWSYDLLDEPAKRAFRTLGIFKRSWTLEAADALFEALKLSGDVEALTEQLLDVSLIKPVLVSHASEPRFNMLQTVHEYANEMLAESGELEEVRMAFAQYFLTLVSQSEDQLWGLNSEPWFDKIEYEYQNIRASFNAFVDHKNYEGAWKMFYLVHMFWHARGGLGEVDLWKERAKIEPSLEQSDPAIMAIDKSVKAKAYMWMAYCDFFLFHIQGGLEKLHRAEEFFRELGDQGNLAIALSMDGGYGVYCNTPDFEEKLMEAEAIIRSGDYVLAKCFLFTWAIEYYRLKGEIETVEARIKEAKQLSTLYEMPLIRFFTTIVKLTEMYNSNSDYERMAAECKSAIDAFPEKSYKSSRGSLMGGCAMCLLLQGRIEESLDWFVPAMELILESGDKEAYYHGVIGSIIYFMHVNRPDISVKCMGALDHFIEVAHYPMSGQTKLEYDFAGSFLEPLKTDARYTEWYALGQRLSLDQAFRLAFSQMQTDAKSVA